jgi:hypothetical protein
MSKPKRKELKALIRHAWIHSGYPSCGYGQMTTEQKKLFCKVVGHDFEEYDRDFRAYIKRLDQERDNA